ncbi:MAG: GldG family protein, partial [Planctomycetes bacterium]|nr:GldG family protein [Planctomycetota bacterium]
MKRSRAFKQRATLIVLLLGATLVALNALAFRVDAGIDLTPNYRHSVSDDVTALFKRFNTPMRVEYYVSASLPPAFAGLEREVVRRLSAIADGAGADAFAFEPSRDVVRLDDSAKTIETLKSLKIPPVALPSGAETVYFYSALKITHAAAREPVVIPRILSAASMQYDLISKALRLSMLKVQPATPDDTFRGLRSGVRFVYVYGDMNGDEMPSAKIHVRDGVWAELERIQQLNPAYISVSKELAGKSRFTPRLKRVQDITSGESGSAPESIIYFSSVVAIGQFGEESSFDQIKNTEGLATLLAGGAWALGAAREKVGFFTPSQRPELSEPEQKVLYSPRYGNSMPEDRATSISLALDYITTGVMIDFDHTIPQGLGVLVLVRPGALNPRQLYEIRAFLARGGHVLLIGGEWHTPLIDRYFGINPASTSLADVWLPNQSGPSFTLRAQRMKETMSGLLKDYGVETEAGILLSQRQSVPYRVYGPGQTTPGQLYPDPIRQNGVLGIVPYATPTGHLLTSDVNKLPLRGASPLKLDETRLKTLGLSAQVLFKAPGDAELLRPLHDTGRITLNYRATTMSPLDVLAPKRDNDTGVELVSAPDAIVGVLIEGQFPFDPNEPPPTLPDGRIPYSPGMGSAFTPKPGKLVVISSPDLFEVTDVRGWRQGEPPLVGGSDQLEESSRRRLLANVLDAFIFGEELVRVRGSTTPVPHRLDEWTLDEIRLWCGLVLGLAPAAVLV